MTTKSESKSHRITTPAPPVDLSKLAAAIDALAKASDELRSTVVQLATQNADLRQRLELAYAHDPASVDYADTHAHNTGAQATVDDLAAKLAASAQAMSETAAANAPGPMPAAPKQPAPKPEAA